MVLKNCIISGRQRPACRSRIVTTMCRWSGMMTYLSIVMFGNLFWVSPIHFRMIRFCGGGERHAGRSLQWAPFQTMGCGYGCRALRNNCRVAHSHNSLIDWVFVLLTPCQSPGNSIPYLRCVFNPVGNDLRVVPLLYAAQIWGTAHRPFPTFIVLEYLFENNGCLFCGIMV